MLTAETKSNFKLEWTQDVKENLKKWTEIIAFNLQIPEKDALKKILRNNSLPIVETVELPYKTNFEDGTNTYYFGIDRTITYSRFNANIVLLAEASPNYLGPRGGRPIFVTPKNILEISGIEKNNYKQGLKLLKQLETNITNYLLETKLSASNPNFAPSKTEFSKNDIFRGIYISRNIDFYTAAALGIIYGLGYIHKNESLRLVTNYKNELFIEEVKKIFELAFNFHQDKDIQIQQKTNNNKQLFLTYKSKALVTFLTNYCKFPLCKEEKTITGFNRIMNLSPTLENVFLKYYLASNAVFLDNRGWLLINSTSKPQLEDLQKIILKKVHKDSMNLNKKSNRESYSLIIGTLPTLELYHLGFLDANPNIKNGIEVFIGRGLSGKARKFLEKINY